MDLLVLVRGELLGWVLDDLWLIAPHLVVVRLVVQAELLVVDRLSRGGILSNLVSWGQSGVLCWSPFVRAAEQVGLLLLNERVACQSHALDLIEGVGRDLRHFRIGLDVIQNVDIGAVPEATGAALPAAILPGGRLARLL